MTKGEVLNIANRLDDQSKLLIEKEVEERLEILREGDLSEEELEEMELYLFASLVFQEYLDGEYELLEDERQALFDEMEEMYNKYSDLLVRARIEEKVGKKKKMTLELMRIRERLLQSKQDYKDLKQMMKDNRNKKDELKKATKKEKMKDYSKIAKKDDARGGGLLEGLPAKQVAAQEKKLHETDRRLKRAEAQLAAVKKHDKDEGQSLYTTIDRTKGSNKAERDAGGHKPSPNNHRTSNELIDAVDNVVDNVIPSLVNVEPVNDAWANMVKQTNRENKAQNQDFEQNIQEQQTQFVNSFKKNK